MLRRCLRRLSVEAGPPEPKPTSAGLVVAGLTLVGCVWVATRDPGADPWTQDMKTLPPSSDQLNSK